MICHSTTLPAGSVTTNKIEHHFTAINDLERNILRDEEHKLKKTVENIVSFLVVSFTLSIPSYCLLAVFGECLTTKSLYKNTFSTLY